MISYCSPDEFELIPEYSQEWQESGTYPLASRICEYNKKIKFLMIKKSIESLTWVESSHGSGQKRVLLRDNETATNITQVAITPLKAGEE